MIYAGGLVKMDNLQMADLFIEKLAGFKQNEKPEAVLLIADEPERIKIIIAWTNTQVVQADNLTALVNTSEKEIWAWLWENTFYSADELKEKIDASFSEKGLENKMKPLIGNYIIYPDGMINSYVQRYLREKIINLFERKTIKIAGKTE
jgi:hypothetical protein